LKVRLPGIHASAVGRSKIKENSARSEVARMLVKPINDELKIDTPRMQDQDNQDHLTAGRRLKLDIVKTSSQISDRRWNPKAGAMRIIPNA
jgi:hypothetical protein